MASPKSGLMIISLPPGKGTATPYTRAPSAMGTLETSWRATSSKVAGLKMAVGVDVGRGVDGTGVGVGDDVTAGAEAGVVSGVRAAVGAALVATAVVGCASVVAAAGVMTTSTALGGDWQLSSMSEKTDAISISLTNRLVDDMCRISLSSSVETFNLPSKS